MRGIPTSPFRAPLFPLASRASSASLPLAFVACIGSIETQGTPSYVLVALAVLLAMFAFRRAWRVARRETERLALRCR